MDINIKMINENVSSYLTSLNVNHPDFSVKELKKHLKDMIGQEPAIEIKREAKVINELLIKSGAKTNDTKERINEIHVYYVDMEKQKPVSLTLLF